MTNDRLLTTFSGLCLSSVLFLGYRILCVMKLTGQSFLAPEGSYKVLHEIARGAFSRVFLATNGEVVKALKVFPQEYTSHAEREYSFGHGLQHAHLNTVEAKLELAGYTCVLMPYLSGQRLSTYFEKADLAAFIKSFRELLTAIAYLHDHAILHRDIKPDNIMISRAGHAKLFDFDLAVRVGETQRRRTLIGTVAYLSPEQAKGVAVSKASDLYSAGVIFYRGITGEVPFTGTVEEVLKAHLSEEVQKVSSFNKQLKPFDDLSARLLAKKQSERFQEAREVLEVLDKVQKVA
jgi:eukaryotic-like serine/threonine-protein kinase